jgi:TolA-binding protein
MSKNQPFSHFFLVTACISIQMQTSAVAQEQSSEDLFTPKPQFPTSQTIQNPQPLASPAGETNPLKGLFTPQPQFQTPQTIPNPEAAPPEGEPNHLKGLFTPQPQFVTPQTNANPEAQPRFFIPERLQKKTGGGDDMQEMDKELQGDLEKETKELNAELKPGSQNGKKAPPVKPVPKTAAQLKNAAATKNANAKPPNASKAATENGTSVPSRVEAKVEEDVSPLRHAMRLMTIGQMDKSLDVISDVIVANPADVQAHYLKAVVLVTMKRYPEACAEYREVLTLRPNSKISELAQQGLKNIGY